jgi:hypothetical protein
MNKDQCFVGALVQTDVGELDHGIGKVVALNAHTATVLTPPSNLRGFMCKEQFAYRRLTLRTDVQQPQKEEPHVP